MNRAILAYVRHPGQLPPAAAAQLRAVLPYGRRMRLAADGTAAAASLLGIALARHLLAVLGDCEPQRVQLRFPHGGKPCCPGGADFSITHAGNWVAAAVCQHGRVGVDLEQDMAPGHGALSGDRAAWTAREATVKAGGGTLADVADVQVSGAGCRWRQQYWQLLRPESPAGMLAALVSERPLTLSVHHLAWETLLSGRTVACA